MSASRELLHVLQAQGIHCFVSFPDKWLYSFLQALDHTPSLIHMPATIEREALGIAVGAQLAGMRSALVMQNSGIGNLLNDWASLAHNYQIAVPWIISDRGSKGEKVATQKIWRRRLHAILAAAEIPAQTFTSSEQLPELADYLQLGYATSQCVAALFPYAFWQKDLETGPDAMQSDTLSLPVIGNHPYFEASLSPTPSRATWRRYEALSCLLEALTYEFLFVTLGDPCKEIYDIQDRHETFYMLGSMGLVLPLGLGFSRAANALGESRKTVVIDGDGSQLMQLGSLGTLSREQPDLALIIIDNGSYGSTGDQPTLTRQYANLEGIAQAFGLTNTATVATPLAFEDRLRAILSAPGPSVTVVLVQPGAPQTPLVPLSPSQIAPRFQATVSPPLRSPSRPFASFADTPTLPGKLGI